ncbi:MAG: hypothetical protein LBL04_09700 [Bacteroidales bacterium]|jgi:hypothetical protein|nr:hypothetical protein [Bacteroidales bacterium]
MELQERILKIIDTCEEGSKSQFAAKTGLYNQIYNLLKPGYKPRKITIDRIISVYPNISAEWLMSDIGDMTAVGSNVGHKEEKTESPDQIQNPVHDSTSVQIPEPHERLLKIIDTCENGSKSQFAAKTGLRNQAYSLLKPGHKLGKINIDRIISAYPNISADWLTSGIGDMTTVGSTVESRGKTAGKFLLAELPDHLTARQVLSHVLKYSGVDSLSKLSIKLNVRLSDLNQVYNETKPMGTKLAQTIHKTFPEIPYQWIKTGENPSGKSQSSPQKQDIMKQDTDKPQIQSPVHDSTSDQTISLHERILKIIDACENGAKSRFAAKTGLHKQVYNLLKPGYKTKKINIDRIISAYPEISIDWLTSGTGDMTIVRPAVEHMGEKTDKFQFHDSTSVQARELQERILKIIDTCENGSKYRFAAKTGVRNQIYTLLKPGHKPGKVTIDRIISTYPNISAEWLTSGIGDMTTARPAVEHREEKTDKLPDQIQIQSPVHDSTSVQTQGLTSVQTQGLTSVQALESIDDKSYIQALELQIQTILKINEGLLSDYQKVIGINQRLNNAVIELTGKVIDFNSKI